MESGGIAPFIVNSALDGCESLPSHPCWKEIPVLAENEAEQAKEKNPFSCWDVVFIYYID
jgi:hypothetical protein